MVNWRDIPSNRQGIDSALNRAITLISSTDGSKSLIARIRLLQYVLEGDIWSYRLKAIALLEKAELINKES